MADDKEMSAAFPFESKFMEIEGATTRPKPTHTVV